MEEKKKPEADLGKRSGLFLIMGLVLSLSFVITAFEWRFYDDGSKVDLVRITDNFDEFIEIPTTEHKLKPPPVPEVIIIEIPNDEEIEEEIEINIDVEITGETEVKNLVNFEAPDEEIAEETFDKVEEDPYFGEDGINEFYKYIGKNIKYPPTARKMGVEGKVYIQFVVDKDGPLTEVKVVKGIGAGCDEEAIRVVKASPKWTPGKQRGRAVKVRMHLPIIFQLSK